MIAPIDVHGELLRDFSFSFVLSALVGFESYEWSVKEMEDWHYLFARTHRLLLRGSLETSQ